MPLLYPTRRLIALALLGAPLALLLGLVAPGLWAVGLIWPVGLLAWASLDAALAPSLRALSPRTFLPPELAVGRTDEARLEVSARTPAQLRLEAALEVDGPAGLQFGIQSVAAAGKDRCDAIFALSPWRRGLAVWRGLQLRWRGPFGLVWRQARVSLAAETPIGADGRRLEQEALRLYARDAAFGSRVQPNAGEGSEFEALRDYQTGMDRRAIDWKASARHQALKAREFRTERNHQVLLAIDCGRAMSEPVGKAPRIDHAIHAALLVAFVSLKAGDRAGLFAFDERPRLSTGPLSGMAAFSSLRREAARIDYGTGEPNYTLGLTTLSAGLGRRSLVVIFTEFPDTTSAELMIETVGRLLRTHLVLFAVFRDEELESLVETEPGSAADMTRAVVAATLLRERDLVLARLRRLGAHVVEASADRLGSAALNAYLDLKRRDLL